MDDISLQIRHCKRSGATKLNLANKGIKMIPVDMFQLAKVEVLDLSGNSILSLDSKISSMTNLKFLDISNNQLMTLPKDILKLTKLQVFNVSGNPLSTQFSALLSKENQSEPLLQTALNESFDDNSMQKAFNEPMSQSASFGFKADRPGTVQSKKPSWLSNDTDSHSADLPQRGAGSGLNFGAGSVGDVGSDESEQLKKQVKNLEQLLASEQRKQFDLKSEVQALNDKLAKTSKSGGFSALTINQSPLDIDPSLTKTLEVDINELEIGDGISQGGFSIVHKGYFRGTKVAIKKVFNPNITPDLIADLSNEIKMLNTLRHPNIVLLMGICTKPPNLCIVTDFLSNGSLFNHLHLSKNELKPQLRLDIAKQTASVLQYMHLSKVVHRDIKSHNVLLDDKFQVKICDFGLAREYENLNTGTMQFGGTPSYMAPELFQKKAYDKKVDVFAFGSLLWEIFARQVPFEGLEPADVAQRVLDQEPLDMQGVPKRLINLILECRATDPKKRPDFSYIVQALEEAIV